MPLSFPQMRLVVVNGRAKHNAWCRTCEQWVCEEPQSVKAAVEEARRAHGPEKLCRRAVSLREQLQEYTDTTAAYHRGEDVIPGDCWRACLASLLEVPIADVPHFAHLYPTEGTLEWWDASVAWVRETLPGWTLGCWRRPEEGWFQRFYSADEAANAPDRVILTAASPRGAWNHSVLVSVRTGELAHDPFPGGTGVGEGPWDVVGLARLEWLS
ncbi:hypothetical protein GCM10009775_04360 [Microbacterium aoyamense]|uniref:Papain-like cysteine protease AvrRpt2 n=1 Tax=Microbacterium aoyamense TaxID=344166 RepID=A0ABN2P853_9MICO|nr:hypothetical protein [Microbacterium aoyamense]